jgi:hypothetical protein
MMFVVVTWGPWNQFREIEEALMEKNKDVIEKIGLLELKENGHGL